MKSVTLELCVSWLILCAGCVSEFDAPAKLMAATAGQNIAMAGRSMQATVIDASTPDDEQNASDSVGGQPPLIINIDQSMIEQSIDGSVAPNEMTEPNDAVVLDAGLAESDSDLDAVDDMMVDDIGVVDGLVEPGPRMPNSVVSTMFAGNVSEGEIANDQCESGAVLTGLRGGLRVDESKIGRLSGVCGTPIVTADGTISVRGADVLVSRGRGQGDAFNLTCPVNEVVIGFQGREDGQLEALRLKCGRLQLDGNYLMPVAPSFTMMAGGNEGALFPEIQCPGRELATGLLTRSGSGIYAFALICDDVRRP